MIQHPLEDLRYLLIRSRWHLDNIDSSDIKLVAAALDPCHKALKCDLICKNPEQSRIYGYSVSCIFVLYVL